MKFNETLNSISKLYSSGKLEDCCLKLKFLLTEITNDVRNNSSSETYEDFYDELLKIVDEEAAHLLDYLAEKSTSHFVLLTLILKCIRNSFYQSSIRQNFIVFDERKRNILLTVLNAILTSYATVKSIDESLNQDREQEMQSMNDAANASITCFVNMIAGQPSARKTLWPFMNHKFKELLSFPASEVQVVSAALLYQFLLEDEFLQDIVNECDIYVPLLLNIYTTESPDVCFSLFCLKIFLSSPDVASSIWRELSEKQRLLTLDIFSSFVVEKNSELQIRRPTLEFLQLIYKKDSDCILNNQGKNSAVDPIVMHRLLGFLCNVAASDSYQRIIQQDRSLLITTLYLLKSLSLQPKIAEVSEEPSFHPHVGFKRDIIRLLACLVSKNKANQDLVGELEGVTLLMESSQFDEKNPLIREACIFALRNLLEGNEENQKVLTSLELRGMAENQTLHKLGLSASVQDGKIAMNQIP